MLLNSRFGSREPSLYPRHESIGMADGPPRVGGNPGPSAGQRVCDTEDSLGRVVGKLVRLGGVLRGVCRAIECRARAKDVH